jgi:hypothetical protein
LIGYLQSETTRLSEAKKNAEAAAGVQGHHHHGHNHKH